jgi:hypothetical protein
MAMNHPTNAENELKVRKVVINCCHSGFALSPEAMLELHRRGCSGIEAKRVEDVFAKHGDASALDFDEQIYRWRSYLSSGEPLDLFQTYFSSDERFVLGCPTIVRDDRDLVAVVEQLGTRANGPLATLEIVEIPEDVVWEIAERDGLEHVAEVHRTWYGKGQ